MGSFYSKLLQCNTSLFLLQGKIVSFEKIGHISSWLNNWPGNWPQCLRLDAVPLVGDEHQKRFGTRNYSHERFGTQKWGVVDPRISVIDFFDPKMRSLTPKIWLRCFHGLRMCRNLSQVLHTYSTRADMSQDVEMQLLNEVRIPWNVTIIHMLANDVSTCICYAKTKQSKTIATITWTKNCPCKSN